ncbi:MAG: ankyrin repeat domain-containing protein [Planctomycetota bacterium]
MKRRHLPNYPRRETLELEAKTLLTNALASAESAVTELRSVHAEPASATLADAQQALAMSYGVPSWQRLMQACEMIHAIRTDDLATVESLVQNHPELLHEDARGVAGNWGPPLSYAANLGHLAIVQALYAAGSRDIQHAFERACLQGKLDTARWLFEQGAEVVPGIVMGACETQNGDGLELLLQLGAELVDAEGDRLAPLALLLETYCRDPEGKHKCLSLVSQRCDIELPDTPVMAVHRGSIEALERQFESDPDVVHRRFSYRDIYPLELGCHRDETLGLHGTPLDGTTLLHLCVDMDEVSLASWLLAHGADVNAKATLDDEGFGGHTPLFNAAVSQAHTCGRQRDGAMVRMLLDAGADPHARANLRKTLRFVEDETMHEFHNVTPLEYAQEFHDQRWCNPEVNRLLAQALRG